MSSVPGTRPASTERCIRRSTPRPSRLASQAPTTETKISRPSVFDDADGVADLQQHVELGERHGDEQDDQHWQHAPMLPAGPVGHP